MSATFPLNIYKYMEMILKMRILVQLYQQTLDCLNITYTIIFIPSKSRFRFFNFFVYDINGANVF